MKKEIKKDIKFLQDTRLVFCLVPDLIVMIEEYFCPLISFTDTQWQGHFSSGKFQIIPAAKGDANFFLSLSADNSSFELYLGFISFLKGYEFISNIFATQFGSSQHVIPIFHDDAKISYVYLNVVTQRDPHLKSREFIFTMNSQIWYFSEKTMQLIWDEMNFVHSYLKFLV